MIRRAIAIVLIAAMFLGGAGLTLSWFLFGGSNRLLIGGVLLVAFGALWLKEGLVARRSDTDRLQI